MAFDEQRLCVELQRLDWARDVPPQILQEIAASAQLMEFRTGEAVIALDSQVDRVYFVITGRVACVLFDRVGKLIQRDVLGRGSVVGLISTLMPDRSYLQVEAVEHTTAISLTLPELLQLSAKHPEFQLAMFRVTANLVKKLVMVDRDLPKPAVVAVVHHSEASRRLTAQLAQRLRQLGETPAIASDDPNFQSHEGIPHRLLFENGAFLPAEQIRGQLQQWASHSRLFVDVRSDHSSEDFQRLAAYADVVLWCVRPEDATSAVQQLRTLDQCAPNLRTKTCVVWILNVDTPAPPYVPDLLELAVRDFKTYSGELKLNQGTLLQRGVERLVHYLRGVQIGLALGGGAARGMAHLGVFKALEDHGIFVDMLAGTSAGAMTGGVYASGLDPGYATQCFKHDLHPNWFFRQLPGGGYWYLLYKYRFRQFDPMLRKYLANLHMEQLTIPVAMISVDLVEGVPLIRDRGDVTHNILESINLPPLSLPILRREQAVVDGGLLNNVPADTLVAKGCNFVIASTVTSRLEQDFMGIRSKKSRGASRFLATIQVIMRQNMIVRYSMNAVGVQPADLVIAPNVTSFDVSEFTRADEMAVEGERATNESISQLKAMLSKLDPKLFPHESRQS